MNKVDEQELNRLRELNEKFSDSRAKLADIEIASRRLRTQKEAVFLDMDSLREDFKHLEATLVSKYGNVSINLETGEFSDEK